jgi:membrane protease subunit (stomatin/prohibitin family)
MMPLFGEGGFLNDTLKVKGNFEVTYRTYSLDTRFAWSVLGQKSKCPQFASSIFLFNLQDMDEVVFGIDRPVVMRSYISPAG